MVVMNKGSINWKDTGVHVTCGHQNKSRGVTFDSVDVIELDSLEECIVFDDDGDDDEPEVLD